MRRYGLWLVALVVCFGTVRAQEKPSKPLEDVWYAAHVVGGGRIGWVHISVEPIKNNGRVLYQTTQAIDLTIKRYKAVAHLHAESGTVEDADGKVTRVFMRQQLGQGQQLVLTGKVERDGLHVQVDGGRIDKMVRWNDQVLGLRKQMQLIGERKVKPGDHFSFLSYEPVINSVLPMQVTVREEEEVKLPQGKRRLLPVVITPDKVEAGATKIQLPAMVTWLDKTWTPVCRQMELDALGKIMLYPTTQAMAQAPATPAEAQGVELKTFVPLNRAIAHPHQTNRVVYRVTIQGDDHAATAFAQDARQAIKNSKGSTFDLQVQARRAPQQIDRPLDAKAEFQKSCYYLKSDDTRIRELARTAVGAETDPWRKAQAIERWVCDHMRWSDEMPFAPADQVARNLTGDCRQCAMLTAAMCRAVGVPSRTAIGLIYAHDAQRRPALAFHMWVEVWIGGQWLGIDGTLGNGSIGACHLKVTDHSWYDTETLTPLLPLHRVLGKVAVEIVRVGENR